MSTNEQDGIDRAAVDRLVAASVTAIEEACARAGFRVAVDNDMFALRRYLQACGAYDNPSFDPNEHDLSRDAFWLRAEDASGRIVASHAERIYRCRDFVQEIIETDRVWFDKGVALETSTWRSAVTHPPVPISGTIGFAGGMFVQPEHRGSGLALYLPYLSRSLCLRDHGTDWHTGLVRENIARTRVATEYYGFPRTTHLFFGTIPRTTGDFKDLHLCWMDRAESLRRLHEMPSHARYPVAIPGA